MGGRVQQVAHGTGHAGVHKTRDGRFRRTAPCVVRSACCNTHAYARAAAPLDYLALAPAPLGVQLFVISVRTDEIDRDARRTAKMALLLLALPLVSLSASPSSADALTRALYELQPAPQLVVFATGGGMQLAPMLLSTPGASRAVLDVQLPYSRSSLVQLLGGREPASFCSADVAYDLAAVAFERARALNAEEQQQQQQDADADVGVDAESAVPQSPSPIVGLGCTAALRSEPMNRGPHRCYVAVRTAAGTLSLELTLAKGARSRAAEDAVVSRVALVALAHACSVEGAPPPGGIDAAAFWQLAPDEDAASRSSSSGGAEVGVEASVASERLAVTFRPTR